MHIKLFIENMTCVFVLANSKGLFDVIVLDPPWYNKSAKRSGK